MLQYVASQKEVKPANVSSFFIIVQAQHSKLGVPIHLVLYRFQYYSQLSPYRILTENIIQGDLSYPSYFINILIFKVSCTTI